MALEITGGGAEYLKAAEYLIRIGVRLEHIEMDVIE